MDDEMDKACQTVGKFFEKKGTLIRVPRVLSLTF